MFDQVGPDLSKVGAALLRVVPADWKTITLNVTAAGSMIGSDIDVELADGSMTGAVSLDLDGELACDELRQKMYQQGKGTWYAARFVVNQSKELTADFDYEARPFGGNATDDLMREDQELYPRDSAHLPEWHPNRTAESSSRSLSD